MLFDEVDRFYAPAGDAYYQQGDIVLAPNALLTPGPEPPNQVVVLGTPLWRKLWDGDEFELAVPAVFAEAQVSPAMIMSHDCALDKELEFRRLDRESRTTRADRDGLSGWAARGRGNRRSPESSGCPRPWRRLTADAACPA